LGGVRRAKGLSGRLRRPPGRAGRGRSGPAVFRGAGPRGGARGEIDPGPLLADGAQRIPLIDGEERVL
jgi:hypothetical protein